MTVKPHHWPRRHFIHVADDIGVAVEPRCHNEQGDSLYEFYVSKTQDMRTLTEAETVDLFKDLANQTVHRRSVTILL